MSRAKNPTFTTSAAFSVGDHRNSHTASPRGPLLTHDWKFFEKRAHVDRERVPELVVHAKGSGAQPDRSTP